MGWKAALAEPALELTLLHRTLAAQSGASTAKGPKCATQKACAN